MDWNPAEVTMAEIFDNIEFWNRNKTKKFHCSNSFKAAYQILYNINKEYFEMPSKEELLDNLNKEFLCDIEVSGDLTRKKKK